MAEKTLNNIRIINKHDTEANWKKATGFIPKQGELIIYDKDSTYNYERFKIGDGSTVVSSLPFADANKVDKVSGKGLSANDYTTTEKNKLAGIAEGANKTVVDSALSSTSTNPVQNKAVNTAISNLSTKIGDKPVAEQIGDAIDDTIVGLSVSGKVITYTKGDGSTGTITTQDTNTIYNAMTGATETVAGAAGLVPAPAAGKNTSFLRGDGTWVIPTNTTYNAATTSTTGLMSAADKTKLDGIATGANAYTHPSYTARTGVPTANQTPAFGGTFTVTQPVSDATGHITAMNSRTITIPSATATTSAAGLMSAADKTTLNNLNTRVGDKSVTEQITSAIDSKLVTWSKVANKPFNDGDIVVSWDGNTTGKTYVSASGDLYYKVSDEVFRTFDFTNDNSYLSVVDSSLNTPITEPIPLSNVVEEDGVLVIGSYNIISTPYNNMELYFNNKFVTFPTAGTYFRYIPDAFYISSLTVTKASGKIVSKALPQGVASKADLLKYSNDGRWTQIYNSGTTTKNVNAFSNIDISGYTKLKVAIKCVNVTASAGTTSGAVIFTDEFGMDYSFSSLFGNLITNTVGTAGAMAEFTVVDGFIICDNALRSTSAANMLSNTDGQGAWNLTSVGGGLITCSGALETMNIATTNLSTTHYYGTGSKVIVWGCKA